MAALRAERAGLHAAARQGTDDAVAAARLRQDKAALEAVVAQLNAKVPPPPPAHAPRRTRVRRHVRGRVRSSAPLHTHLRTCPDTNTHAKNARARTRAHPQPPRSQVALARLACCSRRARAKRLEAPLARAT